MQSEKNTMFEDKENNSPKHKVYITKVRLGDEWCKGLDEGKEVTHPGYEEKFIKKVNFKQSEPFAMVISTQRISSDDLNQKSSAPSYDIKTDQNQNNQLDNINNKDIKFKTGYILMFDYHYGTEEVFLENRKDVAPYIQLLYKTFQNLKLRNFRLFKHTYHIEKLDVNFDEELKNVDTSGKKEIDPNKQKEYNERVNFSSNAGKK